MSAEPTPTITIERHIAAPASAVFAAWTTPEHFARWFGGPEIEVPLDSLDFRAEPGRSWTAQMNLPDGNVMDWTGDFVEVTPNERLVWTLTDQPAEPDRAQMVVELTESADGTHLLFTQETPGFSAEQQAAVLAGWESFIDELERIATA